MSSKANQFYVSMLKTSLSMKVIQECVEFFIHMIKIFPSDLA